MTLMTSTRPKRKATINKTYNDAIDYTNQEYDSGNSSSTSVSGLNTPGGTTKKRSTKRTSTPQLEKSDSNVSNNKTPQPSSALKSTIPYNWQPPPISEDFFSFKLDLTDAYIDLGIQTLYCPKQSPTSKGNITTSSNSGTSSRKRNGNIFTLSKGQYIYMISEPPGEPYYIGRIRGFTSKKHKTSDDDIYHLQEGIVQASDYSFQIQWFYRPRDISKLTSDSRLLFASMHTDTCPLTSFRGLVTVEHKQDIEDRYLNDSKLQKQLRNNNKKSASPSTTLSSLELYTQKPNCFYFDKLFDRYMIKFYDVLSTKNLLQYADVENSKSKNFLIALNKRFEFIFVESQRTKSLVNTFSSNSCNCEICGQWCDSTQDSISCVECNHYYHMLCLDPPLLKKPSRGFSWSCASCTKKHEIEYHSKKMLMLSHDNKSSNQDQLAIELNALSSFDHDISSSMPSTIPSSQEDEQQQQQPLSESQIDDPVATLPKYETMAIDFLTKDRQNTFEKRRLKEEWCMRYLGMYARLEDGVDLDDRSPYPRASTRLGSKHQAVNIPECDGDHPLVYYDIEKPQQQSKKKSGSQNNKKAKQKETEETLKKLEVPKEYADMDPKSYPAWLQPRPKGYIERGVDDGEGETCTLLWKSSDEDINDNFSNLDSYITKCAPIAESLELSPNSPNFMDAILLYYMNHKGDSEKAYQDALQLTKISLKEPVFTKEEIKRFEAGVKLFGSELHPVFKKVKTQTSAMIVRFYYLWKKTKNGRLIWGNFEGRIQKKVQNMVKDEAAVAAEKASKIDSHPVIDELADAEDDSCYDNEKILAKRSKLVCKHCNSHRSFQWFRITGHDAKKPNEENYVVGLCFRCAKLWRRYAVIWEHPNEVMKKTGGKSGGWKKRVENELLTDAYKILEFAEQNGSVLGDEVQDDGYPAVVQANTKVSPIMQAEKKPTGTSNEQPKSESPAKKKRSASPTNSGASKNKKPKAQSKAASIEVERKEGTTTTKSASSATASTPVEQSKRRATSELSDESSKKQRKQTWNWPSPEKVDNPVLNPDYIVPSVSNYKLDKKWHLNLSRSEIDFIINSFRTKQLVEINSQLANLQIPHLSSIQLPFEPSERKCCICREHDTSKSSLLEMLICSSCGVNVHSSCAGINIPEKAPKPIKEWLCEPCINDLHPVHNTVYSCTLCLANESNYELSIMGSPIVRPDYLKPTDTGKWCHLLCAVFNHELVSFRQPPSRKTKKFSEEELKNTKNVIEAMNSLISIDNVSRVYLNNYKHHCGICDSQNGALIGCYKCENETKYHITCAQDTPNFKLGFKLVEEVGEFDKDIQLVNVDGKLGKLRPILVCPKHDQSRYTILNSRTLGKRVHSKSDDLKPLFQLFLEDLVKPNSVNNGQNIKSINYINNCQIYNKRFEIPSLLKPSEVKKRILKCRRCSTDTSPKWWDTHDDLKLALCQSCYHKKDQDGKLEDQEEKEPTLLDILTKPLNGENYGIIDQDDKLSKIYKPNLIEEEKEEKIIEVKQEVKPTVESTVRSKISLGDLLT
ncbi:SNT2 [[Candida] subhashii]|uniref:SNT2 n=1 Tax=[Candida] subhashii TaxID=561895 RepID=A0A8J5Q534_9ASCO|nr:SNT2 [[Candida] subhashii]KAG7661694.1 SNT2 [[Candida] subhashii]